MTSRTQQILLTLASMILASIELAASGDELRLTQSLRDTALPLGSNLTLSCRFSPQPSYIIWTFTAPSSAAKTLLRCQPSLGSCVVIDAVPGFAGINENAEANGSLTLTGVTASQNGVYQCGALLRIEAVSSQAAVTVMAAPSTPVIEVPGADSGAGAGTVTVRRGASLSLKCSAAGANPAPDIVWTRTRLGGGEKWNLSANSTVTPSAAPFGVTVGHLMLTAVAAADDGAQFRCTALHPLENRTSDRFELRVLYEPNVTQLKPLALELGSEATVECSASGNPVPLVHLADAAGKALSADSLRTSRHRLLARHKNQSGLLQCIGTNSMGTSNSSFSLDIQYGPAVTARSQLTVRAGASLETDCSAEANPPPTGAEWRHVTADGGGDDERRLIGRRLRLEVVARSDAGVWRCQFENRLSAELLAGSGAGVGAGAERRRVGWADVQLVVEYPPEQPSIRASRLLDGQLNLLAGDSVTVGCSANEESPGIPAPRLTWTRLNSGGGGGNPSASASSQLSISNASLSDTGLYFCTPVNSLGSGRSAVLRLSVEQPPRWLVPSSAAPRTVTSAVNASDFRLACPTALALPEATVRWLKDGQPLELSGAEGRFSVESQSEAAEVAGILTVSYLHFRGAQRLRLQPEDNGRYQCELTNRHGTLVTEMQLLVEFPPQIEPGQRKVAAPATGEVGVSLVCSAMAQPPPSLSWQFNGAAVAAAATANTVEGDPAYRRSSRLDGVTALGTYTCLATNLLGTHHRDFLLVPPGPPDPPEQLAVTAVGWDFVSVVWQRGFDGGSPARHWLVAAEPGRTGNLTWPADPASQAAANATGLMPGVNYTFQVYASSRLGRSGLSQPLWRVTPAMSLPKPSRVQLTQSGNLLVSALDSFCLRVESSEDGGDSWSVYQFCLPSGSIELTSMNRRLLYRASLCLTRRPEVCGLPTLATGVAAASMASLPEIPTSAIIIVGAGCAALILLLCSVLAYFCCKKPVQYKEMDGRRQAAAGHYRAASAAEAAAAAVPQYQTSDGKPYALVPPHPPSSTTSASVSGPEVKHLDSRRSSMQKEELLVMETSADRRSTVFATLRSAHNPLDSSTSNAAMFSYAPEDFADDNRNTVDPYGFEGHYQSRPKRIVYEVVV